MNPLRALSFIRQRLSRLSSAMTRAVLFRFVIGVGILAAPLLSSSGWAAPKNRLRPGGRAVQTDNEPNLRAAPQAEGDLSLSREGERKASALAAFAEGLLSEEDGDNERAFQAYRRSLASDPNHSELAVKVAFELARRGDVAEGISLLKDAAKAAPKEMLPPLCLSQIYAKFLKKPALAIRYASAALELAPDNISPYLALTELYTEAGQPRKAAAILDRALKSQSRDPDFWAQLGELCYRLDVPREGSPWPTEKLQRLNTLFEKALSHGSKDADILAKAADFYFETQQYHQAIPLLKKVIAAEDDPASDDGLVLREKLARSLMSAGHRGEALRLLEKMAEDAPRRKETCALIGDIHLMEGRLNEALAAYREVIRLDSTLSPAYLRVADLEMRVGQPEQALATLQSARKKFPGTALITYSLAATLGQVGRYKEALHYFEETLREAPDSKPGLPNANFYFAYGMAAEQAGEIERAAALLQKCIGLSHDDSAQACNYLGYMWIERGLHLREAGELIRRAVAQEPTNGAYLDSLGWYYFKTGEYAKAISELLKAIGYIREPDAVVYEHLGDAYAASGELPKAIEAWQKALPLEGAGKQGLAGKIEAARSKLAPVP